MVDVYWFGQFVDWVVFVVVVQFLVVMVVVVLVLVEEGWQVFFVYVQEFDVDFGYVY